MLITEQISPDSLSVRCNYYDSYVERFRMIPGAEFDKENKLWIVPTLMVDEYEDLFKGEIVWKTPRWVVMGEKAPDYSKLYQVDSSILCPDLKKPPFPYQKFGIRLMIDRLRRFGFIVNSDDVGIGKTIQGIGTMKYFVENCNVKRILIACKKSIKYQWLSEIKSFSDLVDGIPGVIVEGTAKKRAKIYDEFGKSSKGVMIINYQTLLNDREKLIALNFDMVVCDEVHYIKARTGQMNKAMCQVAQNIPYKIFLTGTPIMSRPDDLYGVFQIADRKYLGAWGPFDKKYIVSEYNGQYRRFVGCTELDDLRNKVQDVVFRRTENEVAIELPKMLPPTKISCLMDDTQEALLCAITADQIKMQESRSDLDKYPDTPDIQKRKTVLDGAIKGLVAARQAAANDPRLFHMSKSQNLIKKFGPFIPKDYKMSSKTEALLDLIQDIVDNGYKVIVFSKFERSTRLLQDDIMKKLKFESVVYTGVIDDEERKKNIEKFKNDPDCCVLFATDAAAEGLNLQCARFCINYDQPYTPAIKTQRAGRIRRIGSQYKSVRVYDMVSIGSIDEDILDKLEKAQGLFDGLISLNEAQSNALKEAMRKEA